MYGKGVSIIHLFFFFLKNEIREDFNRDTRMKLIKMMRKEAEAISKSVLNATFGFVDRKEGNQRTANSLGINVQVL